MKLKPLLVALAVALPLTAHADGDVIYDIGDGEGGYLGAYAVAEGPGGRLYFTNPNFVVGVDSIGQRLAGFGANGLVTSQGNKAIAVRPDGTLVTGTNYSSQFSIFDAAGAHGDPVNACSGCVDAFLTMASGFTYFGGARYNLQLRPESWALGRITAGGLLDTTFGSGGLPTGISLVDGSPSNHISTLRPLPGGKFVAYGFHETTQAASIGRFNADGSTDFTFGVNGVVAVTSPAWTKSQYAVRSELGIDHSQRMLVPGGANVLTRLNADGTPDNTYTTLAVPAGTTYSAFALDSQDRAIVFGVRADQAYVARLLPNGGLDNSFGTLGEALLVPNVQNIAFVRVEFGLVDSADRPTLLLTIARTQGSPTTALMRLTTSGVGDATFGAGVTDDDSYPDAITIAAKTAVAGTSTVVSAPIVPTGFNVRTKVTHTTPTNLANKGVSIGCGAFYVTTDTAISPGESMCLRLAAPDTVGASNSVTVNVGGQQAIYTVTAIAGGADITPDPFSFTNQTVSTTGAQIISAPVTITGITGFAPVAVSGGRYGIDCHSPFVSSNGFITNGQTVCLLVNAPATYGASATATLAINGVTGTFTVSTSPVDTTPDAFSFTSQSGLAQGGVAQSNTVTIMGINTPAPLTVSGGEYSLDCNGTFTSASGTVAPTQAVCVRNIVGASTTTTTLTVGGVAGTFSSAPVVTPTPPPSGGGGSGGGGGGGGALGGELALLGLLGALRAIYSSSRGTR